MNKKQSSDHLLFSWSGLNQFGEKVSGEILVKNKLYGIVNLKKQGITSIIIRKKHNYFSKKIQPIDIALFLRQLATLIHAGIPLVQACSILEITYQNSVLKSLIISIKKEIESGFPFSTQLQKFPHYFDSFICDLIKLGEQTGKFDHTLLQSAAYKEKSLALKKQIKQAMLYPAMITVVAISVTLIMLVFIIPRFAVIFEAAHQELPVFTQFIFTLSLLLKKYFCIGFILPFCLIGFIYSFKRFPALRKKMDYFIFKIPVFGNVINKVLLTRLAHNLALTSSAGMPLLDSLNILAINSNNSAYSQSIYQLHSAIDRGHQLHTAMLQNPLFPTLLTQMIKIGEESGKLETMLEKIAILYEQELECFINNQKQLLEPLIIIILGVLIGGLVIAMYLPVFKLGTVI